MGKRLNENQQGDFLNRMLLNIKERAGAVCQELGFIMEAEVDFSDASIDAVERHHRDLAKSGDVTQEEIQDQEQLLAHYVGQAIIERESGSVWAISKLSEFGPIVVSLQNGGIVSPFLLCGSLHLKTGLLGANSGTSLRKFVSNPGSAAIH